MPVATVVDPRSVFHSYGENGYLILPSILERSELEELRSAVADAT